MAVQFSSISIPCCGFPPSHSLKPSPHSQQQSLLQVCSLIPMLQVPVPVCTGGHTSPSRAHRAMVQTICVVFTLSSLPHIGLFTLLQQPQMLPFCPNWFPCWWRGFPRCGSLSSASAPPTQGAGPVLLPLLLLLPSFFHPTQLYGDLYSPFWCPRFSASV